MKNSKLVGHIALLLLVAASGSELLLRGVLRIVVRGGDLASPYVSAQRLIHGKNPYSSDDFLTDWHADGAPANKLLDESAIRPIYPPTALVVVSPLATVSWPVAVQLYGWGCTIVYMGLVWLLSGTVGDSRRSARRLGFVAFCLGLSPIHAGISQGNLSVIVFLFCGYGLFLAWRRYEIFSGILLGLALCIKPMSAIAAIAVLLLYGRIRAFIASIGLSAAVAICSAIAFCHVNPIWKMDYVKNMAFLFGPTGAANFAIPGGNFDLVNLQTPLYAIWCDAKIANALTVAVVAGLCAVWLYLYLRERRQQQNWNWLSVSSLLLIGLLPVYQRNYNAEPIIFAAMWAFAVLRMRDAGGKVAALISLVFLVPGEAALRDMSLPAPLWSSLLWKALVMSQLTWAIAASIVLCYFYRLQEIERAEKLRT